MLFLLSYRRAAVLMGATQENLTVHADWLQGTRCIMLTADTQAR